jgi:hypothetical protein
LAASRLAWQAVSAAEIFEEKVAAREKEVLIEGQPMQVEIDLVEPPQTTPDRKLQEALNKIVDNIHAAKRKRRIQPLQNRVCQAFQENRELMKYYGFSLDNIRCLTCEQRQMLLDELEPSFEGCYEATFDKDMKYRDDFLSISDQEMIDMVAECRGQVSTRRPRDRSDFNGPSFLCVPLEDTPPSGTGDWDKTARLRPQSKDNWWARITKRKGETDAT